MMPLALFALRVFSVSLVGGMALAALLLTITRDTKESPVTVLKGCFILIAPFYMACELAYWAFVWSRS